MNHLEKWSDEAFLLSIEWANRAEQLRREGLVGPSLLAESLGITARCFHNATRPAGGKR